MTGLRPPSEVMTLARMGAAHQTRLSFLRVLLRGMARENWRFDRPEWQIRADGTGHAVYRAMGPTHTYSLIAFAHDLPDSQRTDRVIAEAWDATFVLFDGVPDAADIARLAANVPKQEAGRVTDRELVLSRANRSTRLWDHVVGALAAGRQPAAGLLAEVGYLMRTTAVYGSGKFGLADHAAFAGRGLMDGPFRAEMLTVWLIRSFCLDLVEHVARSKGGDRAAALTPSLRGALGVGNSTGLGMAPFLVHHPDLLNAWVTARETALWRVRSQDKAAPDTVPAFLNALDRMHALLRDWHSTDPAQQDEIAQLHEDLAALSSEAPTHLEGPQPWDALWQWGAQTLSVPGQEMLASLMIEPHGALVDDLAETMGADERDGFLINGAQSVAALSSALKAQFGWALEQDHEARENSARFWYVSQAKLEPRLGERHDEPGSDLEQPLDIARRAKALAKDLDNFTQDSTAADFLTAHPAHRLIIRRIQRSADAPYAEIRESLITAAMRPIDMLRCKLAFFGATRFDPRSDRWVRITLFQHAPFPEGLTPENAEAWILPHSPEAIQA